MVAKASWFKLFTYVSTTIYRSFITIFLLLFSVLVSTITIIVLFSLNSLPSVFFINFQYFIIIFYSIFLFIFILMNAIKIFGLQIKDSSFLLLLTKPYSRTAIILTQYLGLFLVAFTFIFTNILALVISGSIIGKIMKVVFLQFYLISLLKFFVFACLFAILVITGVVTMLAFTPIQIVFLIFIIFCSLFLLGSLPYDLVKANDDPISLNLQNVGNFNVKTIKNTILFNKYLKQGSIKYPYLTTKIFDFENSLTDQELKDYRQDAMLAKRNVFFNQLGLLEKDHNKKVKTASGRVTTWKGDLDYSNKDVKIQISFNNYFIDLEELQTNSINNHLDQDLLQLIADYDQQYGIKKYMEYQKNKVPQLLSYDLNQANTYVEDLTTSKQDAMTDRIINELFLGSPNYNIVGKLGISYDAIFENPVYFVARSVEDYIYYQVLNYRNISNNFVNIDANYQKLLQHEKVYTLINYLNFIEQWNQLWTYTMGYYGDFWFEPLTLEPIAFDCQQNFLFSYPDFKLTLINGKIATNQLTYFQNNQLIIVIYAGISIMLFLLSYGMFMKKNIN